MIRSRLKAKKRSGKDLNWKWLLIPAFALLAAILLNTFCIVCAIVPSASMESTVKKGSLILANRLAYINEGPDRGDIILFSHEELGASLIMKRIVGMPGETVTIISGQIYVNQESLSEPYVTGRSGEDFGPVTVPDGHYFVLGDNRENSLDARFWEDPFVSAEEIHAKAVLTLLPVIQTIE